MVLDRRLKRSALSSVALKYWLSSTAQRSRTLALVLADWSGLVVASSAAGPDVEELAALAPLAHRCSSLHANELSSQNESPVRVQSLDYEGAKLFLCAVADTAEQCERGLRMAGVGVRRILTDAA